MSKKVEENNKSDSKYDNVCFVIMPIGEKEGYPENHFQEVYEDIFIPAIKEAGFKPLRADDEKSSSMIQIDIVKSIVNSPMAICDLSTRNPNVLFELGIRQAFDLPVVLVQEKGTPRIFDIGNINTIDYDKGLGHRDVLKARERIRESIIATQDRSRGINSIIRLLEIEEAKVSSNENITENDELKMMIYSLTNEVRAIRDKATIDNVNRSFDFNDPVINFIEYERELARFERILLNNRKHGLPLESRIVADYMEELEDLFKKISKDNNLGNVEKDMLLEIIKSLIGILDAKEK